MSDEFYIGWETKAAPGIGKTVRGAVVGLLFLTALAAVLFAVAQRMIGTSIFEWGNPKTFSGILKAQPYPHLLVPWPGNVDALPSSSTYYLVAPWKFGLSREVVQPLDGQAVTLKGTLIYRESQTMIEVLPNSIKVRLEQPDLRPSTLDPPPSFPITLIGEIVDSKCFLGVMNPGQLTPHRACAIRCISGGVPPVLFVRRKDAPPLYFLLVSADGKPVNKQVLDMIAEPIKITGQVQRQGDLWILRSDPATYRRL